MSEGIKEYMAADYVDLSSLPSPKVVEELDFEAIFQELLADFKKRRPEYDALLESDPVIVALQTAAYRELLLRNRINEAAKANMLAYATGSDLDNLAAFFGVERLEGEQDDRLCYRARLSLESLTTAGSEKAYQFHVLSASPLVKSVSVLTPAEGRVLITILSTEGNGVADGELIRAVGDYVSAEDKRPLTDHVVVQSAKIVPFSVRAKVFVFAGPSVSITREEFTANLQRYLGKQHHIGSVIALSGIFDALHAEGVQKIKLLSPAEDVITTKEQAAYCSGIELEMEIVNDRS